MIDVNRGLARDSRGNFLWDSEDIEVETAHGNFSERRLLGQPNGGVRHRIGPGGMNIYMYNDQPGVFYNERGVRVPDSFWTGSDLEELKKKGRRLAAMKLATEKVEEDFAGVAGVKIMREAGEYRLVEIAPNHYQIQFVEEDGRGSPLTPLPMTLKQAEKVFAELAPDAPSYVPDAPAKG